jgi:glycosyltransferase involved in cell wall biosynthesis
MNSAADTILIVHVTSEWQSTNRRYAFKALAESLPANAGVLCVNRPVDLAVTPVKRPGKFWRGLWSTRVAFEDPGVWVVTPRLVLHELLAARVPGITSINRWLMRCQLRKAIRRVYPNGKRIIQWIHHPAQSWTFDVFPDAGKVYHAYDEYTCLSDGTFVAERWQKEQRLLRQADLTFVTSQGILRQRQADARRIELLPNGMPAFFLNGARTMPDPIDNIPRPRIGYLGNIFAVLEFGLLEAVFRKRPEWHFVLIGPVQDERLVRGLRQLPNVHFLGTRPHAQLPAVLPRIDVGLIPITINGFTQWLSPLKLFEYLGAGVPVVSTNFQELEELRSLIELVPNDAESFESAIQATLSRDRDSLRKRLQSEALSHTWDVINRERIVPVLRGVFEF